MTDLHPCTDTRTPTERMWDAARDLDEARSAAMKAVQSCEAAGSAAVHNARRALLEFDDGQTVISEEASE